jgi:predicted O-linked N-acetylglucosamine transferase (SPINDLY family)
MPADPTFAQAQAAFREGRLPDALQLIDTLVRRDPGHADAWNLAGVVCHVQRQFDAAIRYFERALALGAGAGVLVNLGFAHQAKGDDDTAGRAYAEATRREPKLAIAWQKLGGLSELLGHTEEALDAYRQAVRLDPNDLKSLGDGLYLRRHLADWGADPVLTPERLLATFASAARSDFSPSLLLSLPEATPAQQLEYAGKFARSQWGPVLSATPLAPNAAPLAGRRLRVGYLSADFREHAVSYLVTEVIAAHDRASVEVFVYAYRAAPATDRWRQAAMEAADHFTDLDPMDDAAAAARIHADGIDVLVDLTGYTAHGRPGINARRPAPVIAHWIGYIGTLGEPRLADYVIGDAIATPPAVAAHFSEALALMPRCYQPNGALVELPPPPTRASEGLPETGVVFCSFNQTYKFNPQTWDDWCTILREVPGSVLWIAPPRHPAAHRRLVAETVRRGVDPARLVLAKHRPRDEHLARLALADLALDTHPYNSGTTASDALRLGVPVLTWPGESFVSRMATSLLHHAGLPECVATDRTGFVAMAVALGKDAQARSTLRRQVRERVVASGLFDPAGFCRDLERLYLVMHAQRLAGRRETIRVSPES